jgi:ribulose-5-phosphate 4-epimerase/fuculose-1-phosphate aldolase|tara:strand:- start:285 stop:524 length:240 start_codon:yes stop_codon:yes gene_type:complete
MGLMYDQITASNLVKIDIDGNIVGGSDQPVNPAGFVIDGAVAADRRHRQSATKLAAPWSRARKFRCQPRSRDLYGTLSC